MVSFKVYGPFEIPLLEGDNGRLIDIKRIDSLFWTKHGAQRGVYIFSMRYYNKHLPYYVGKASEQSFRTECFSDHKVARHYYPTLNAYNGTPFLFLLIPDRAKGPWPASAISRLEERLIAVAASVNKNLSNKRLVPRETGKILGIDEPRRGQPHQGTVTFRNMMSF
jgi:hypothetical protein